MTSRQKYLPLLVLLAILVLFFSLGFHQYLSFTFFQENQKRIEDFVIHNQVLSVLIYAFLYILVVAASIPGATLMTLIGGFLFGQVMGTSIAVFSATVGATLLFLSAKMASQSFLDRRAGPWIEKMQKGFQENAFSYLLTLRLIPLFPFFAINLVAAILQVPLKTFIIATLVGIIPGTFVYVSLGTAMHAVIEQPDFSPNVVLEPEVIVALVGLGVLSLLPTLYKHFYTRHRSK